MTHLSKRGTYKHVFLIVVGLLLTTIPVGAQPQTQRAPTHPQISTPVRALAAALGEGGAVMAAEAPVDRIRTSATGEIGVEVRVRGATADAAAAIADTGIRVSAWSADFPMVGAWVQPEQLDALAALPMVVYVDPMWSPVVRTGNITSAGDDLLRAAEARSLFGLSGAGVRIGIVSDGVAGLATAQNSGELPADCPTPLPSNAPSCVFVDANNSGSGNEGRAMLEIVHDLAPGATLGFSSGINGVTGFVAAIDFLQNEFEADVIVDDIGYLTEPFFENGTIGTRAQQAVNAGVVFVSAAGNDAQIHYQADLDIPDNCVSGVALECLHRFAPSDTSQSFVLNNGESLQVVLQWDNPFDDASDDLDLFLLDGNTQLAKSDADQLVTKQPLEFASYTNTTGGVQQVDVIVDVFALRSGTVPEVEMLFSSVVVPEYQTIFDSIYGHPGMPGVVSVGAVDVSTPQDISIQSYSSQGPVTISNPVPEVRSKPDIVATDCVETSAPGFTIFCGTSAAAPHIAALAALILEQEPTATPNRVRTLLTDGAVDAGAAGFDNVFGAGLADAVNAIPRQPRELPPRLWIPLLGR